MQDIKQCFPPKNKEIATEYVHNTELNKTMK